MADQKYREFYVAARVRIAVGCPRAADDYDKFDAATYLTGAYDRAMRESDELDGVEQLIVFDSLEDLAADLIEGTLERALMEG